MTVGFVGSFTRYTTISSIVTAAATHNMTDLDTIKDELMLTKTDASRDAVLNRYIVEASAAAENYCNRVFVVETILDQFFPRRDPPFQVVADGIDPLQLSRSPIASLASVTEDGTALIENTDFLKDAARGQLIRLDVNGYPKRWNALPISVQYDGGYLPLPADVTASGIRMVAQRHFARIRDPLVKSEVVDGIGRTDYITSNSAEGNMPTDVIDLLDNYRMPTIA